MTARCGLDSRRTLLTLPALGSMLLIACSSNPPRTPPIDPDVARADISTRIPSNIPNRDAWAADIFAAFESLELQPTPRNSCAVIAVIQQESARPDR